jgi:hypothetical protein
LNGAAADSSGPFNIVSPLLAGLPDTVDMGSVEVNDTAVTILTVRNDGDAPLDVASIASDNPHFTLSRVTMSIAAADSDTVTVTYAPEAVETETAAITFASNSPFAPHDVILLGEGTAMVGVGDRVPGPKSFAMRQNRPNPFGGVTRIEYALPTQVRVRLDVFSLDGRRVATLVDDVKGPGEFSIDFDPDAPAAGSKPLASGIYFYRIQAGAFSRTHRMMIVR